MHWIRSDAGRSLARSPLTLSSFIAAAFFFTLQALAVPPTILTAAFVAAVWFACLYLLRMIEYWRYLPYLQVVLMTAICGHLGLLLGVVQDLGPVGLIVLASWCSVRVEYGLNDALAMLRVAPWGHVGMLLGCNLGMWLSGCGDLPALRHGMPKGRFLLLCNLGMLSGMLVLQLWSPAFSGRGISFIALVISMQMLAGMVAGMVGAWWIAGRLYVPSAAQPAPVGRGPD